ncbi:putative glycosyl transferase [Maioricimonas rarisocia]|uniref:Putative glycosyl transferase n=1 Tax=Maioricimonas rarisocia TaxID=2528026 RepID=A0A517Z0T9_9PLAN|nr:glycosyltransferase family 4 protein [Maioricimonas rarisocia]QDU36094.1 putative glycosyl transferase [Maioricimonas rarisocia]
MTKSQTILFITPNFPPVVSAGVHRTVRFVRYLPEYGWQPVVLAFDPGTTSDTASALDIPADLAVHRVARKGQAPRPASQPKGTRSAAAASSELVRKPNGVLRTLKDVARNTLDLLTETPDKHVDWNAPALSEARRMVDQYQPQAIYTSGPPHSVHLIGRKLKLQTGLPWIADFRDPWARRPWGDKPANPWGQRLYPWYERRCISAADCVILNTERMAADFRSHYPNLPSEKFLCIPNACDPALADRIDGLLSGSQPLASDGTITLCHAGSLYRQRDPRPLIEALTEAPSVRFEQTGSCAEQFDVAGFAARHGVSERVQVSPPVPHAEILERMAAADVQVLLQPGTDLQIPGKLFEMILFRKPILALCDEGETADLVRKYRLGVVASPTDPAAIAAAIKELSAPGADNADQPGWDQARDDFDARKLTGTLAEIIDGVTAGRQARNTQTMTTPLTDTSVEQVC